MAAKKTHAKQARKDITLLDVVVHMEHMEQRLLSKIDAVDERLSYKIDGMGKRIDTLEVNLTSRIDALEEDLTATMKDAYVIRKHIGLAASHDE